MLQIQSISKRYVTGDLVQKALDEVSLNLRDNEFVAILGPSGSGKTTLLNIIGGLDRYDSGDLIINGISTKKYKDRDWDSYRNHTIGFVFQSYNLIPHQSILANVELALTISGIKPAERKARAIKALEQVGLGDQLHKKPNQMSGGQMQRVAIARALVNDPDILLADEPTGALDTETSVQVMDLLKEVAKDKLVVMVTHNPELAEEYATRIVKLRDGKIIGDSDPYMPDLTGMAPPEHKNMGKASMSFLTALSLSFNNLWTKKGRTTLTAFAGSIGIIGIALILSLSNGVNRYIKDIQKSTMTSYPITIEERAFDLSSLLQTAQERKDALEGKINPTHDMDAVYSDGSEFEMASSVTGNISENNLTDFKKYLDNPDSEIRNYLGENGVVYSYDISFDVYTYAPDGTLMDTDGKVVELEKDPSTSLSISTGNSGYGMYASMFSMNQSLFSEIVPGQDGNQISPAVDGYYEVAYGSWPKAYDEVVLVMDSRNEISVSTLYQMGLYEIEDYEKLQKDIEDGKVIDFESERYSYEDICKKELYLIPKCDYYMEDEENEGIFRYEGKNGKKIASLVEDKPIKLKITGIVRPKEGAKGISIRTSLGYTNALTRYLIDYTDRSPVVVAQKDDPKIDVTSGLEFSIPDDEAKAANAKRFVETLSNADKAIVFQSIMSEFTTEELMELSGQGGGMSYPGMGGDMSGYPGMGGDMSGYPGMSGEGMGLPEGMTMPEGMEIPEGMTVPEGMVNPEDLTVDDPMNLPEGMNPLIAKPMDESGSEIETPDGVVPELTEAETEAVTDAETEEATEEATEEESETEDPMKAMTEYNNNLMAGMLDNYLEDEPKQSILIKIYDLFVSTGTMDDNLEKFGVVSLDAPSSISIYTDSFENKDHISECIKEYNRNVENEDDKIVYTDTVALLMSSITTIVNVISYVLIAFVAVSLIVSSIMIGIITYISVLERTKEIGILRAIGASKGNISQVFNAETFIVGLFAGLIGIGITLLILIPGNIIIHAVAQTTDVSARLPIVGAIILVILSVILTLIGGIIPSMHAAKKDPVTALRTE